MVCAFRVSLEERRGFSDVGSDRRARVLVVDGKSIAAEVIERYRQREAFAVDLAGDGQSGFDLARSIGPHLIIPGSMLPSSSTSAPRRCRRWSAMS